MAAIHGKEHMAGNVTTRERNSREICPIRILDEVPQGIRVIKVLASLITQTRSAKDSLKEGSS